MVILGDLVEYLIEESFACLKNRCVIIGHGSQKGFRLGVRQYDCKLGESGVGHKSSNREPKGLQLYR